MASKSENQLYDLIDLLLWSIVSGIYNRPQKVKTIHVQIHI